MEHNVLNLKATINIHDRNKVMAYGREQQVQLGKFTDAVMSGLDSKAMGEASEILTKAINQINTYNVTCEKKGGFFSFLVKPKNKLIELQNKYQTLAKDMDYIVEDLMVKDLALGQISRNFNLMYEENKNAYEFLTKVICAGEQVLEDEKTKLRVIQMEAEQSGDWIKKEEASRYNDDIAEFESRISDLKLTRTIAVSQSAQIISIQKSIDMVSKSIKTTIVNAIPLWKSQMAIALGLEVVKESLNSVSVVKDAINQTMTSNAELNKQLILDAANLAQTGVVDIETLNTVNKTLLETLNGSYQITQKAMTDRQEEAKQLQNNEAELKESIIKYTNL